MNVYDFDHTVYRGDSSVDFMFFHFREHPRLWIYLPVQLFICAAIFLHLLPIKKGKEKFFSFLSLKPASPQEIANFWKARADRISPWYLMRQKSTDCIISASLDFLLRPLVNDRWGVRLIATNMSPDSGKIDGENCKGREKVSRFSACCSGDKIDSFFSDSLSDTPLAQIAKRAFVIRLKKNGTPKLHPWPEQPLK